MSYKTDFTKIDTDIYEYDAEEADYVVEYIESVIKHTSGELAGKPFILEEWQKNEIIKPLFGWKNKKTGYRKYRSAYIELPKKNGKTATAAALAAVFLDIESEGGDVPIYSIAGNKDQAGLSFRATKGYFEQSPYLMDRATIYRHSIVMGTKYFKPMARDSKTQQGVNPQLCIVDELHIHQDGDLLENMEKSMAARRQPLTFIITTAGDNLYGIGYERHLYAIDVATGKREDDSLLVCIYCADKNDDPYSEETWKKANPNYGISVYPQFFHDEIKKAKFSPASLNSFKRYHLNIWTNTKDAWINNDVWNKSGKDFDISLLEGRECYGGLDLAISNDLNAFALIFPMDDGSFVSRTWFWLPSETVDNEIDSNRNYQEWVDKELIMQTPGSTTDYALVREFIINECKKYKPIAIGYDPYNAMETVKKLEESGLKMFSLTQNMPNLAPPTKEIESLILQEKFNHLNNPVLAWNAANCVVIEDNMDNKKLIKDKTKPKQRIDGVIANVIAMAMYMDDETRRPKGSYLEKDDLFFI